MSVDLNNFNLINGGKFEETELVINKKKGGIKSGGFDIKSSIMRAGVPPITTFNQNGGKVGGNNVSDLFSDSLVLPYWATFQPTLGGSKHKDANDSDDDDIITDDIHEKLLELVKEHKNKKLTKKVGKKGGKKSRKNIQYKIL